MRDNRHPTGVTTARSGPESYLRRAWEGGVPAPVAAGLWGLSLGYRGLLATREWLYARQILKTARLPCLVVSIGNITLGGNGKTPLVELAVRALGEMGARPAVVSRGYGRRGRGVHVVADGERVLLGPEAAGDEPSLLAKRLAGVPVVVGEDREAAGLVAVERCGATAIVLDDGFQQRTLRKDLEVLAVNASAPWGNGHVFPRGILREPLRALRRAQLVVMTNPRSPRELQAVQADLHRHNARALVLSASYRPLEAHDTLSGRHVPPSALQGLRLLGFAGLAFPRGFAETLASLGVRLTRLVQFPDHHWYREGEIEDLAREALATGAEGLITTEKDWMRLQEVRLPSMVALWVLPVALSFDSGAEAWVEALGAAWTASGAGG